MNSGISLGRVWNVPIRLSLSWFLIAGLITWSLASGYFPGAYPGINPLVYWVLGAVTAVLFAVSVLLHELGHVALALREGIPVKGVTLFIFGGVAQISREPKSPGGEFRIAIAGPIVSLLLSGFFGLIWLLNQSIPLIAAPTEYMMRINFMLAVFNLIPGFPLDGGRVLRALVWKLTGNVHRATRVASVAGQMVAFGFIAFGILTVIRGNFFNGLWLAFIGWFLQNAASSAFQQTAVQQSLEGVTVSQVMDSQFTEVSGLTSLQRLVDESVLYHGQRNFLVREDGEIKGLVTLQSIAAIPQRQWPYVTARQAMAAVDRLEGIAPYMELLTAIQKMESEQRQSLPVLEDRRVVGILSRDNVMRYLRARSELGM